MFELSFFCYRRPNSSAFISEKRKRIAMIGQEETLPTVSILIPVFNREKFIGESIQSALDQTFKDIEIIVVDNASTDGTWGICQEFAARDPRIRIFRNEINIGPVRNWLRCVKEAKGKFTKILFSDDLLDPIFIERTIHLLEDLSVAFVYTAVCIGEVMGSGVVAYLNGLKSIYSIDRYWSLLVYGKVPFSPGAALFRTNDVRNNLHEAFPTCGHHEFRHHGAGPDVMLYALTTLHYKAVAVVEEPLAFFRAHEDSISIINKNNTVSDGYRAALSWFFAKYGNHSLWYEYIVEQWIIDLERARSWCGIKKYLKNYEGTGELKEQIQFMLKVFSLICLKKWRSLARLAAHGSSKIP